MYKVKIILENETLEFIVDNLKELEEYFKLPNYGVYIESTSHYERKLK